jgi:hypothetical protein
MLTVDELLIELQKHDLQRCLQLDAATYIENIFNTVKSHEMYLKANPKNKAYMPYYNRLVKILQKLETNECTIVI